METIRSEWVTSLAKYYLDLIEERYIEPKKDSVNYDILSKKYLIEQCHLVSKIDNPEKKRNNIGFIQGVLIATEVLTKEEYRSVIKQLLNQENSNV